MNDDELSMRAETASAYLDGNLDAAERSSAAADADTMALVDSFARMRVTLADVVPVSDDTRSAAIAAALAEFDARRSPAPVASAAVATVTRLQARRMRVYRLVTGVAAAAVIGLVTVAALNSAGDDSKTSSSATVALPSEAATRESTQGPAFKTSQTEAVAGASAETSVAAGGVAADSASLAVPPIDNEQALAEYASSFGGVDVASPPAPAGTNAPLAAAEPTLGIASRPLCISSNDTVLGAITVLGTPAFAVRDTSTGVVRALDADDCRVLLSVAAP